MFPLNYLGHSTCCIFLSSEQLEHSSNNSFQDNGVLNSCDGQALLFETTQIPSGRAGSSGDINNTAWGPKQALFTWKYYRPTLVSIAFSSLCWKEQKVWHACQSKGSCMHIHKSHRLPMAFEQYENDSTHNVKQQEWCMCPQNMLNQGKTPRLERKDWVQVLLMILYRLI